MESPISFDEFIRYQWFQKILRLRQFQWARDPSNQNRFISTSFWAFYSTALIQFSFYGFYIYDVVLTSLNEDHISSQNPPVVSMAIYCTIRGIVLFVKRYDIIEFLNILDNEFPQGLSQQKELQVKQIYEYYEQRYQFVNLYSHVAQAAYFLTPLAFFMFTPADVGDPITQDQMLLGGWLPFGLRQNRRVYHLIWLYDAFTIFCGISLFVTFDILFNMMQTHLIMHWNALAREVENINPTDSLGLDNERKFYDKLNGLVRRHQFLNHLCKMYNEIFKTGILISNFVGAFSICFHLYLVTETTDLMTIAKYMLPSLALVGFTFDLCLRGTQLEEASARLQLALYNQNWYQGNQKYRKILLLWLHYAQSTRKLEAYGLTEVNMELFRDIMQMAYKLFAFLKSQ